MFDFLDKIGLKAVLEEIKGKIPTSLPANGGNADTVDGLHADDFFLKSSQVQFVPCNMKYYALNDKICLFSDNDDTAKAIYFINNSSSNITVCVLVSAAARSFSPSP